MPPASGSARDRLLHAAALLLNESSDRTVSTRAVCERAGVQTPTLYHHFGNKQGLIDAVLIHGFTEFVAPAHAPGASDDPLDDVRRGWDRHVEFGLSNPAFYALLYGRVQPNTPCTITAPALSMLVELLNTAARDGLLTVPSQDAAAQILAANVGVTLTLIAQPEGHVDRGLSECVREAAIMAVTTHPPSARHPKPTRASAALTLRALVDDNSDGLTPGETILLQELLGRLSAR